jgi:CLIP-associating protein 1/2
LNEIIQCLSNQQWSERRKGIYNLLNLVQNGRIFNRLEIKRLTEIFTRLFQDPHGKVFSLYLDVLNEFVRQYKRDLNDWLYMLLTRLLTKLGGETLPSVYQKLCKCLEAVRSSFDLDLQFNILVKFINDQQLTASQNLKVKVALLKYLQDIICLMEAADFHTSNDLKYAVSRIISFTVEPKSADIRKVGLFYLLFMFEPFQFNHESYQTGSEP